MIPPALWSARAAWIACGWLYAGGMACLFVFASPWPAAGLIGAGLLANWRAAIARDEERWAAFYAQRDQEGRE